MVADRSSNHLIRANGVFEFGANWRRFLSGINAERIDVAVSSVQRLTGLSTLDGLRFLDVGSGSGLFSLAARRLGAHVLSFDLDPEAVACTEELKCRYAPNDPRWVISRGSVLDEAFMASLGLFDIVYSWGVLHHTGAMWKAMAVALDRVDQRGRFCIAIYNHQRRMTPVWISVKRGYQYVPDSLRPIYVAAAATPLELRAAVGGLVHPREYLKGWMNYARMSQRGMSRWRDWVDWVGGYPFEAATPDDVVAFCVERGCLLYSITTRGSSHGCNEFGFLRHVS
jgi:SAM-dependent methyltransferase